MADPSDGRYALAEAGRKQVVDSAPGHVAQMRRLVFDPLTTAQRRHLGTTVSHRRDGTAGDRRSGHCGAGPDIPPATMADPTGTGPGKVGT
ncbi:hypothetical protein ACIBCD_29770 [Nocardia brasiliensis]|uniref:hypothetical protein n=1 Tax=Nocardia brasiliensis TaxID=37326 RepID=UPI003792734C